MSKATAARMKRNTRAVEAFKSAADCIGRIEKDLSLFAVTRGQFSMIDVVRHVISEVGRSRVSVWTWAIAEYEVEAFEYFFTESQISQATLVVDRSAEQRNVKIIDRWRSLFGDSSVRVVMNHSKIATVESESGYRVLCRGSMNLNFNPRFEQLDVTEGGPDFDLVRSIEDELPVLPRFASRSDAASASQLTMAWTDSDLKPFDTPLKVWNK